MPKRIYPGPSASVDLTLSDGSRLQCPAGEPVEIPADLVDGLQGWEIPADQAATVPELREQLKAHGVRIPARANKAALEQLLAEAIAAAAEADSTDDVGDPNPDPDSVPGDDDPDPAAPAEKE